MPLKYRYGDPSVALPLLLLMLQGNSVGVCMKTFHSVVTSGPHTLFSSFVNREFCSRSENLIQKCQQCLSSQDYKCSKKRGLYWKAIIKLCSLKQPHCFKLPVSSAKCSHIERIYKTKASSCCKFREKMYSSRTFYCMQNRDVYINL